MRDMVHVKNQPKEEFTLNGAILVAKVKELVQDGNIRRIIIKNEHSETFIELPVIVAAVGAIATPVTRWRIIVERRS